MLSGILKSAAFAVMLACFTTISGPVQAQTGKWLCTDPGSLPQQGMNYCSFKEFEEADAELNRVWKQVFPEIKSRDKHIDDQWKGFPQAVLNSQRAWIAFRDSHCTAEGFKFRGGSLEPLIYNTCRTGLTQQRIKQLQAFVEEG